MVEVKDVTRLANSQQLRDLHAHAWHQEGAVGDFHERDPVPHDRMAGAGNRHEADPYQLYSMMSGPKPPVWKGTDVSGELLFTRYLGRGHDLDVVQDLLALTAPTWCRRLRVWRDARDQIPIDISDPGALAGAVLGAAGERGETYRALIERYGRGPYERFGGSAELRGAGPELTIVVDLDEWVVAPGGDAKQLGNGIAFQVRRPRVEGRPGAVWLRETMQAWCEALSPAWAAAQQEAEYWAKVMSEGPTIEAVGRDFGQYLPGVFWWNFFGRPYLRLLGIERLRSAPAKHVAVLSDGIVVQLSDDPGEWDTPGYAVVEQQVRDHLGPELFFSKADPDRFGVVPDWDT